MLEIMLMLIICEIVNRRYSFSLVAQNNEKCVKKGKKNRMRSIRLKIGVNRHSEMNDGNRIKLMMIAGDILVASEGFVDIQCCQILKNKLLILTLNYYCLMLGAYFAIPQ
ncbi:hypothetical protein ACLB1E_17110 [Escherichia coli]